jgi:hypothetical protein
MALLFQRNTYEARGVRGEYVGYYNKERSRSSIGYEGLVDFNKDLSTIKLQKSRKCGKAKLFNQF